MSKRFLNWLILTIRTVALIPGKVNFTRLSRYGGRTAKTFASNFKASVDWMKVNIGMTCESFGPGDDIAVAIDPSFISNFPSWLSMSVRKSYGRIIPICRWRSLNASCLSRISPQQLFRLTGNLRISK